MPIGFIHGCGFRTESSLTSMPGVTNDTFFFFNALRYKDTRLAEDKNARLGEGFSCFLACRGQTGSSSSVMGPVV